MSAAVLALLFQLASFAPPQATDYVVHLEIVPGHDASSGDRRIVYRAGSLIRTDWTLYQDSTGSTYVDLARGLSVSASRNREGVLTGVTIHPSADLSSGRRQRRLPTGRHDRVLGESCTIWRILEENAGSGSEICETADGILLWRAFWYPPGNRTVMYERATAVERRSVRREELLPPRTLLALAAEPPATGAAGMAGPDYEVEMAGEDRADGSYVLRSHGSFFSQERRERGEHSFYVSNRAVRVSYSETDAGRPLSLEINRVGTRPFDALVARWERVPGRAPERVLGETCTWQDNMAIRSDEQNYECRTADGIALKTETGGHWGPVRHFTARRLSRRPLADADFAPPARALDWAAWGITPAP